MLSSLRGKLACRKSVLRVTHVGKQYPREETLNFLQLMRGPQLVSALRLPATEMSLWRHFEYIGDLGPSDLGQGAMSWYPCLDCLLDAGCSRVKASSLGRAAPFSKGQVLERGSMVSCWPLESLIVKESFILMGD